MQHTKSACVKRPTPWRLKPFIAIFFAFVLAFSLMPIGVNQAKASTTMTLKYNEDLLCKGKQVSGACLCYSYSYVTSIVTGKKYSPSKFKLNDNTWSAKSMEGDDKGEFTYSGSKYSKSSAAKAELQYVYDKVTTDHPVILYVSTKTGGEHWVVIVGVTDATRSNLSLKNFLMLDSAYVENNQAPKVMKVADKGYSLRFAQDNVRASNSAVGSQSQNSNQNQTQQQMIKISSATYPAKLSYGDGFMPKGTIKSSTKITKIKAYIYDASGKTVQTATVKPNTTTAKLQSKYSGKKIAGALKFSKLKPGNYSYAVRAYTASGSTWVLPKKAFNIYAPQTKISSISKLTKTSAQVAWKKVKGATGYQLRYSTKQSMSGSKKLTSSAKKKTLSKLKKGTTYYVQVRSYKKANGKRCYGKWSTVKSFTTKGATAAKAASSSVNSSSASSGTAKTGVAKAATTTSTVKAS